jgi:hypothetical protein
LPSPSGRQTCNSLSTALVGIVADTGYSEIMGGGPGYDKPGDDGILARNVISAVWDAAC